MTYSKSILCGLLAISCSLQACQKSNSEAPATPMGIRINQTSYTQNNIGEVREGSSVFQTAIQAAQEATPTYVTVYFQEKIQPRGGLDLIPSYITVSHDGSTRQGKWTGGTARTSSYQNGRPTLLFDQCQFEGVITLTGTFVYRQKSNEPEEIFLWPDGAPFAQWLSGEPYWDGNNLGNIQNPQIMVYRPDIQTAPAPAVLICPGGSYKTVATYHEGSLVAQWFKEQGFVAAVLYYAFPSGHPEIPLSDAQQGIRYLKEHHYSIQSNPNHVGVVGFSAGGHLAAFVSTAFNHDDIDVALPEKRAESRPDFSILFYPVITMTEEPYVHEGSRDNLLGSSPTPEMCRACSPELLITPQTPPALLFHAADDNGVKIQNAMRYVEGLQAQNIPAQLITLPSGGHGFGFYPDYGCLPQVEEAILKWLHEVPLKNQ